VTPRARARAAKERSFIDNQEVTEREPRAGGKEEEEEGEEGEEGTRKRKRKIKGDNVSKWVVEGVILFFTPNKRDRLIPSKKAMNVGWRMREEREREREKFTDNQIDD